MPITKSARKAARQSIRKASFNKRRKVSMRVAVKEVKLAMGEGERTDLSKVAQSLSGAYKAIDKAAKRGVIKTNTASRKKSRLALAANKSASPSS